MPTRKTTHHPEDHPPKESIVQEVAAHPVSTGIGATAGGITGATLGLVVGGPLGEVVGALIGVAVGGWGGSAIGELIDPAEEDEFWRQSHPAQPHAKQGVEYDAFAPAYRLGYERYFQFKGQERSFDEAEPNLRHEYELTDAPLPWEEVREAAKAAWTRVHEKQQAKATRQAKGSVGSQMVFPVSHEAVQVRAFFIYQNEGYPQGRALDHWLRAEREQHAIQAQAQRGSV
jgi:hypothetical protein